MMKIHWVLETNLNFEKILAVRTEQFKFQKYQNPLGLAVKNEKHQTLRKFSALSSENLKFQNDENPLGFKDKPEL